VNIIAVEVHRAPAAETMFAGQFKHERTMPSGQIAFKTPIDRVGDNRRDAQRGAPADCRSGRNRSCLEFVASITPSLLSLCGRCTSGVRNGASPVRSWSIVDAIKASFDVSEIRAARGWRQGRANSLCAAGLEAEMGTDRTWSASTDWRKQRQPRWQPTRRLVARCSGVDHRAHSRDAKRRLRGESDGHREG